MKCPCHSEKTYVTCCEIYHKGKNPPSALMLMRSRYSAYALGIVDYIIATTHPSHPDNALPLQKRKKEIATFCRHTRFQGLEISDFQEKGNHATVKFKAILFQNGSEKSFIEESLFERVGDKWLYKGVL
jgi:SEC-C motif domain protein